jgi:hypothetical protein
MRAGGPAGGERWSVLVGAREQRPCPPASGQAHNTGTYAACRATAACVRGVRNGSCMLRPGWSEHQGRAGGTPEFGGGWPGWPLAKWQVVTGCHWKKLWGRREQVESG